MKKIVLFLSVIILSFSLQQCTSSKKYLQRGQYDAAIGKAAKKLRKNPAKEKEIAVLEEAFIQANKQDMDRINFLKKEGNPGTWDEVFELYSSLKRRQQIVNSLPRLVYKSKKQTLNFPKVDYDQEIIAAKQNAAEYFYTNGKNLLDKGGKYNARSAYENLEKVKYYYPQFRDVDDLMAKAKFEGTSFVLFNMKNKTMIPLPPSFEKELTKISLNDLNSKWITYHTNYDPKLKYDYNISFFIKTVDVSPEKVSETNFTESKEIQDGWNYAKDARGNVLKDSLGNDIKYPKMVTITCFVKDTYQSKVSTISGTLDFINNSTGQLVKTDPVMAQGVFEHVSSVPFGDVRALSEATKKRIGGGPVPFPNDFEMILDTNEKLKEVIKNIIYSNKHILQ